MSVPPVTGFTVTSFSYTSVSLSWDLYDPLDTINNFHLFVGLDSTDRTNMHQISKNINTYTVTQYPFNSGGLLTPNTLYYFTILGHDGNNDSPEVQITQTTKTLAPPTGLISPSNGQVVINTAWNLYEDYTQITDLLFYINTYDPPTSATTLLKSATTRNVSGLLRNTRYYINLRARITQMGMNPTFLSDPATLSVVTNAGPPSNLVINSITPTTITISWTNQVPLPTYNLVGIAKTVAGIVYEQIDGSLSTHTFTNLTPNSLYYFRVRSENQVGVITSLIGSSATTEVVPPILDVTFTNITSSGAIANITYDDLVPDNIDYRYSVTSPPDGLFIVSPPNNQIEITGLNAETTYYFEIRAVIANIESTSFFTSFGTSPLPPPPAGRTNNQNMILRNMWIIMNRRKDRPPIGARR